MMRRSGAGFRRTELRLITHPKRTPPSTATGVERAVTIRQQQDVEFAASGRVVLCIEGPRATRRFANLYYEVSAHDGTRVKGRKIWFGPRVSGVSKARLGIESYEITRPGRYTLRIQGLGTEWTADTEHRIVFTKPYLARSIACVVGITLAGVLLIGSIFFFFLFLTEKGGIA